MFYYDIGFSIYYIQNISFYLNYPKKIGVYILILIKMHLRPYLFWQLIFFKHIFTKIFYR